jgi:hypothetical protein
MSSLLCEQRFGAASSNASVSSTNIILSMKLKTDFRSIYNEQTKSKILTPRLTFDLFHGITCRKFEARLVGKEVKKY